MEDLPIAILQFLFEFLIEIFTWTPFQIEKSARDRSPHRQLFLWFVIACGLACISMLFPKAHMDFHVRIENRQFCQLLPGFTCPHFHKIFLCVAATVR
jgi:hypothetical protein